MSVNQWTTHFKRMALGTLPAGSRYIVRMRGGGSSKSFFRVVPVISPAEQAVNQARSKVRKVVNKRNKGGSRQPKRPVKGPVKGRKKRSGAGPKKPRKTKSPAKQKAPRAKKPKTSRRKPLNKVTIKVVKRRPKTRLVGLGRVSDTLT